MSALTILAAIGAACLAFGLGAIIGEIIVRRRR